MMLSRIANGLYDLGRLVERAKHVIRILEVNHKMNLERSTADDSEMWTTIAKAFECDLERPDEPTIYAELVLSADHPYSVRHCISKARDEGRAMREHISEEMWLHLNQSHLTFQSLRFDSILAIGRSDFNRRIEIYSDALHGLADDTMIRGEAWAFLKVGKLMERALMISRILEIKEKSISSEYDGVPIDVHQWQALLRSLSGYEPYRRAYDARIAPERVLEFVLKSKNFPRSLTCCLTEIRSLIDLVSGHNVLQTDLDHQIAHLLDELRRVDPNELLANNRVDAFLGYVDTTIREISQAMDLAFFTSLRPASVQLSGLPEPRLVPQ